MSLVACPFCDFVTKGAARSDSLRRHVQRKHPGGGDVAFRDNQGFRMVNPITEIFLKVKDVNGTEKYGDAFCVSCYSWIGLNANHVRQSNRVSRCEEHVCKTKQERRPRIPGAKSEPRIRMDYTDFQKAGLGKYIEFNNATDFDLAKTLANINAELTKPTLIENLVRAMPKYRLFFDAIRKEAEDDAKETADEDDILDPVTDDDVFQEVVRIAYFAKNRKVTKLDSGNATVIDQ